MAEQSIYLDNNATTSVTLPVFRKHAQALLYTYGNPSDQYNIGAVARRELDEAREKISDLIGADLSSDNIIFTGCATEANNAVFRSAVKLYPKKKHIIVSCVEHLSVLEVARDLESSGYKVTYVPVDQNGSLDMVALKKALRRDTLLVSIMTANNETGVVFPIDDIVKMVKAYSSEILVHTDAVQAVGKIPINVKQSGVDFLSISGHKFHAPKGVGALYIKGGTRFSSFLLGGHQEKHLRAGTENTASIIAMGEAAIHAKSVAEDQSAICALRDELERELSTLPIDSYIIGAQAPRLSNTTNIAFADVDGVELMLKLSALGIYVATGSACNSEIAEPSHVIMEMSVPTKYQKSIRISVSDLTTQEEISAFLAAIKTLLIKKGR